MKLCRYCGKQFPLGRETAVSARARNLCKDCRFILPKAEAERWAA